MPTLDKEKRQLLSEDQYDADAPDIDSRPDQAEESDDDSVKDRTSREIAERDRDVFDEDYEQEGLLADPENQRKKGTRGLLSGESSKPPQDETQGRRSRRKKLQENVKRSRRRKKLEGESEMMFEMEEGGRLPGSSDEGESRGSSEVDFQRLGDAREQASSRKKRAFRRMAIHLAIILLFLFLLFAAYKATAETSSTAGADLEMVSNGTALFPPTTILLSLDGFRADFLQRGLTPTFSKFIANGISPLWMLPSFPSVTFPNHYTMATGLYPESHGIVGNTFWDPAMREEFSYAKKKQSMQAKWWGGEPIWVTAEKQGVRSAIHMWPGSEAHIGGIDISHVDKYNGAEKLENKVRKIMGYLDLPGREHADFPTLSNSQQRPQFIAAYVPVVDSDGHKYGPNSTEIRETIANVDDMLAKMLSGIQERNLTNIVNVVIVSDHGMATTDVSRLVQLEDLISTDKIEHTDGWPLYGLRPKDPDETQKLYKQLKAKVKDMPNLEVYLRDEDMPERYHFSNNPRIAPLWIVPKAGWAIVTKDEFDVQRALKNGEVYHPRGLHGYDHEHPLMRAVFAARGPAFPHRPNSRVEVFQNTEVYNIVCDSLGIEPVRNNGTLRLPLKPVGLHSDPDAPKAESPADPPTHTSSTTPTTSISIPSIPVSATQITQGNSVSESTSYIEYTTTLEWSASPTGGPAKGEEGGAEHRVSKWWQWLKDKLNGAKDWAKGIINGATNATATTD